MIKLKCLLLFRVVPWYEDLYLKPFWLLKFLFSIQIFLIVIEKFTRTDEFYLDEISLPYFIVMIVDEKQSIFSDYDRYYNVYNVTNRS